MTTFIIYVQMIAIITGAIIIAVLFGDRKILEHKNKVLEKELTKEKAFNTTTNAAIRTYVETGKNAMDALYNHVFPKKDSK